MASKSKIEWTDYTWNPVTGCTKVSPGCDNCYAERFAERFRGTSGHAFEQGFDLRLWPDRLTQPLEMAKPRKIFVNSMSDLFHKEIPLEFIDRVFAVMEMSPLHSFQVLTKRSSRMRDYLHQRYGVDGRHRQARAIPDHIWVGVSIESEEQMVRAFHLTQIPAHVRFVSFEPLISRISKLSFNAVAEHLDWVIVGGESGPKSKIRELPQLALVQLFGWCRVHKIPFFFKQWGGPTPKFGGRELFGRTHDAFPDVEAQRKPREWMHEPPKRDWKVSTRRDAVTPRIPTITLNRADVLAHHFSGEPDESEQETETVES